MSETEEEHPGMKQFLLTKAHSLAAAARDAATNPSFLRGIPYLMLTHAKTLFGGDDILDIPYFMDPIGAAIRNIKEHGKVVNETFLKAVDVFSKKYETARKAIPMALLAGYLSSVTPMTESQAEAYQSLGDKTYGELSDDEKKLFGKYTEGVFSLERGKLMAKGLEMAVAEDGKEMNKALEAMAQSG